MASNNKVSFNSQILHFIVWTIIGITFVYSFTNYYIFNSSDRYHCQALLNDGEWLDSQHSNWQPDGCMLHTYKKNEITSCLKPSSRLVFIGDSTVRQLYYAFIKKVDPNINTYGEKHSNVFFNIEGIKFDFFWDPYLNGSFFYKDHTEDLPTMLIIGGGLWYLRYSDSGGLSQWIQQLEILLPQLNNLSKMVMLLPVEEPIWSKLNKERLLTIHKNDVMVMNEYINNFNQHYIINVPFTYNKMIHQLDEFTQDGLHYSDNILKIQADIGYNLHCNDILPKKFPFDKTCCFRYNSTNIVQLIIIGFFLVWIPLGIFYRRFNLYHNEWNKLLELTVPIEKILIPLLIIGLSVVYMYFADRTNVFMKVQKQYDTGQFSFLSIITLGLGITFLKKADKDQGFLNRDQTDEWKGWMQIAILIYHYLGASKISVIYNPIRVLVASYLFMTGYGHFAYFYKKSEFGFLRIANVMVRLNLLTFILMYSMDTNYLSYYFSPLVSMWFMIIWIIMFLGNQWNKNIYFLITKIFIGAGFMYGLFEIPGILEGLFYFLKVVFNINWNAVEWRFRVTLDLWIVFIGMLISLIHIKIHEMKIMEKNSFCWSEIKKFTIIVAIFSIIGYFWFEITRENKFEYNKYHSYISCVPILGFVILRNSTPYLRSVTSRIFSFIGRCSLETFIFQFHIWLAADTKGLLLILPAKWRLLNFILSTIIFVYLSHHVSQSTGVLTGWFCGMTKQSKSNGNLKGITLGRVGDGNGNGNELLLNGESDIEEEDNDNQDQEFMMKDTSFSLLRIFKRIFWMMKVGWNDSINLFIPISSTHSPVVVPDEPRLRRPSTGRFSSSSRYHQQDQLLSSSSVQVNFQFSSADSMPLLYDRPRSLPSTPQRKSTSPSTGSNSRSSTLISSSEINNNQILNHSHQHSDGDVLLRVGLSTFKVHSIILSLASPVFRAMFNGSWSENSKPHTVELKEDNPIAISSLLDTIYPNSELEIKNWNEISLLLKIADKYDVGKLKKSIGNLLLNFQDDIRNHPVQAMIFAEECSNANQVYNIASRYVLGHFPYHIKDPYFTKLSGKTLAKLSTRFAEFTDTLTTFEFRLYETSFVTCRFKSDTTSQKNFNNVNTNNNSNNQITIPISAHSSCTLALHEARDQLMKRFKELSSTSQLVPISRISYLASTPQAPVSFGHNTHYNQSHHSNHHPSACYHNAPSSISSASTAILGPHYGGGGSVTAAWDLFRSSHLTLPLLSTSFSGDKSTPQFQGGISAAILAVTNSVTNTSSNNSNGNNNNTNGNGNGNPENDVSFHRTCLQHMADKIRQLFDEAFGICAEEVRRRDARYFVSIDLD